MGPSPVMNQGSVLRAPLSVATAPRGFAAGLVPPTAGWEWQAAHWFELKRGPSPLFAPPLTDSTSRKRASPSWKKASSSAVRPGRGPPAPGGPPRTPGSAGGVPPSGGECTQAPVASASAPARSTPFIRRGSMTIASRPGAACARALAAPSNACPAGRAGAGLPRRMLGP